MSGAPLWSARRATRVEGGRGKKVIRCNTDKGVRSARGKQAKADVANNGLRRGQIKPGSCSGRDASRARCRLSCGACCLLRASSLHVCMHAASAHSSARPYPWSKGVVNTSSLYSWSPVPICGRRQATAHGFADEGGYDVAGSSTSMPIFTNKAVCSASVEAVSNTLTWQPELAPCCFWVGVLGFCVFFA